MTDTVWEHDGARPGDATGTRPMSRFLLTYALTVGSLAGFGLIWGEPGFEMLVVAMGWPHVLLGLLFYARKLTPAGSRYRAPFMALVVLTLAISFAHSIVTITTLIYLYFVFHAFRDEIYIYRKRTRGFSFGGSVLDRSGLVFLTAVLVVAGYDQITQFSWRPVYREVTIPVSELLGRSSLDVRFPPVANSANTDYYLSLSVPGSSVPVALVTYMTREDADSTGEMLVNEKPITGALEDGSEHDLYFQARFSAETNEPARFQPDGEAFAATPLSGGHVLGQTFRARADGLEGISLPIVWTGPLSGEMSVKFALQPAALIRFPFLEEAGLLVLILFGGGLVVTRSRRLDVTHRREHLYFAILIALFVVAKLALEISRYYLLVAPLFFSFLVVFHYFSWYVFSLDKIAASPAPAASVGRGWIERVVGKISERGGFLKAVALLNALSLAGVLLWARQPGPGLLDYAFSLDYFLYFLVFHVTMSFAPRTLSPSRF